MDSLRALVLDDVVRDGGCEREGDERGGIDGFFHASAIPEKEKMGKENGGREKDAKKIHGSEKKSSAKIRKFQKINKKTKPRPRIGEKGTEKAGKKAGKGDDAFVCSDDAGRIKGAVDR